MADLAADDGLWRLDVHGLAAGLRRRDFSVREVQGDSSRALDRSALRSVQTPQCFNTGLLRKAFSQPYDPAFTDEASTVERLGVKVNLVEGEEHNIKVTTPLDMQLAEFLL